MALGNRHVGRVNRHPFRSPTREAGQSRAGDGGAGRVQIRGCRRVVVCAGGHAGRDVDRKGDDHRPGGRDCEGAECQVGVPGGGIDCRRPRRPSIESHAARGRIAESGRQGVRDVDARGRGGVDRVADRNRVGRGRAADGVVDVGSAGGLDHGERRKAFGSRRRSRDRGRGGGHDLTGGSVEGTERRRIDGGCAMGAAQHARLRRWNGVRGDDHPTSASASRPVVVRTTGRAGRPGIGTVATVRADGQPVDRAGAGGDDNAAPRPASAAAVVDRRNADASVGGDRAGSRHRSGADHDDAAARTPRRGKRGRVVARAGTASAAQHYPGDRSGESGPAKTADRQVGIPAVAAQTALPSVGAAASSRVLVVGCRP